MPTRANTKSVIRNKQAGERLARLRKRKKFTATEVARILNLSDYRYESLEIGRKPISMMQAGKVAILFRVNYNWLGGYLYPDYRKAARKKKSQAA
jgi:transcriptional regulator with XRE-family HTH domain